MTLLMHLSRKVQRTFLDNRRARKTREIVDAGAMR